MMIKQFTCTALALMFVMCIKAQGFGEIHGKVVDADDKPLEFVMVTASNGVDLVGIETDRDGKYRLKPLKPGEYTIKADLLGHDTLSIKEVVVETDRVTFMKAMRLEEIAVEGDTSKKVVVYGYTKPLLFAPGEHMESLTEEELKHNAAAPGGKINDIVSSMSSDIKKSPDGEDLYFRGSRAGTVIYFIDGMKVTGGNVVVPSSGLRTVSVYTGGVPAKYGDTTGGVIVVETKSYLQDYYKKLNQ